MSNIDEAKLGLVHYIGQAWEETELGWNFDTKIEVEEIVEKIVDAATDRAREQVAKLFNQDERESFRKIAASLCLQGLISNQWKDAVESEATDALKKDGAVLKSIAQVKAKAAVMYADALIEALGL